MKLEDFINPNHLLNQEKYRSTYLNNNPFPHIVLEDFINSNLLERVLNEFPNIPSLKNKIEFKNQKEIKFATNGMGDLGNKSFELISFFNSNIFLEYINEVTGIKEALISDPYLSGGGFHEIKKDGLLKVHADFNKHPHLDLDRRVNLLLYLNKNWNRDWGCGLELYDENDLTKPKVTVTPNFNTCLLFNTTSSTFHGHPNMLDCPKNRSRKSLALYYFSTGRPKSELKSEHNTLFVEVKNEKFKTPIINLLKDFIPPIVTKFISNIKTK